jgi:hypothetical protein
MLIMVVEMVQIDHLLGGGLDTAVFMAGHLVSQNLEGFKLPQKGMQYNLYNYGLGDKNGI